MKRIILACICMLSMVFATAMQQPVGHPLVSESKKHVLIAGGYFAAAMVTISSGIYVVKSCQNNPSRSQFPCYCGAGTIGAPMAAFWAGVELGCQGFKHLFFAMRATSVHNQPPLIAPLAQPQVSFLHVREE